MLKIPGKFRKEFRRTFGIWCCEERRFSRRRRYMSTIHAGSSTYVCRYTTGGSTSYAARTEVVPLSGVTCNVTIAEADWHRGRAMPTMPWMRHPGEELEWRTRAVFQNYLYPPPDIFWSCRNSKFCGCCCVSEYRSWVHFMVSTDVSIRQLGIP
jgi:hypothetical protein